MCLHIRRVPDESAKKIRVFHHSSQSSAKLTLAALECSPAEVAVQPFGFIAPEPTKTRLNAPGAVHHRWQRGERVKTDHRGRGRGRGKTDQFLPVFFGTPKKSYLVSRIPEPGLLCPALKYFLYQYQKVLGHERAVREICLHRETRILHTTSSPIRYKCERIGTCVSEVRACDTAGALGIHRHLSPLLQYGRFSATVQIARDDGKRESENRRREKGKRKHRRNFWPDLALCRIRVLKPLRP